MMHFAQVWYKIRLVQSHMYISCLCYVIYFIQFPFTFSKCFIQHILNYLLLRALYCVTKFNVQFNSTTILSTTYILGNFSFVLQPDESPQPPVDHPSTTTVKTVRKEAKKHKNQKTRGTSTLHFCGKCSKEFSSKTLFIRHLKSHSGLCFVDCGCNQFYLNVKR